MVFPFRKFSTSMFRLIFVSVAICCLVTVDEASATGPSMMAGPSAARGGLAAGVGRPIKWHRDFNAGWQEARRRRLPMVIYITSAKCRYCEAMKQQTWCDPAISDQVNDQFVAITLNPTENADVLSRIDVPVYPMTLVGVAEGKIVGHLKGFQRPDGIRKLMLKIRR